MDRLVKQIPGYYYDQEKRKYFKIQASSAAPASSAYTMEDVKRRIAREESAAIQNALKARQKMQIRRSGISRLPLSGGILEREHGRRFGIDMAEIYATGLVRHGRLRTPSQFAGCGGPLFDIDYRADLGAPMVDVRMAFDDQLFAARANVDKFIRLTEHGQPDLSNNSCIPTINIASWTLERFGGPGDATSLSSHQESRTLAMTWLSGTNRSGIAIVPMLGMPIDSEPDRPTILIAPGGSQDTNVWSSAPAPPSSADLFAFGTSHGVFTVDKERCDIKTITPTLSDWSSNPTDVFALEYLSDNPSILLSGSRRGILNLIDLRLPFSGSDIIRHPSTVTHIKQIDTHRLVVAGLKSSLCQYDLRFRKVDTPQSQPTPSPPPPSNPQRKRRKKSKAANPRKVHLATRPSLTYTGYHNEATIKTGFDIDLETGLIAAAQECDEEHSMVELFSLHGGNRIQCEVARVSTLEESGEDAAMVIRCIKWERDVKGRGKSLYVGSVNDVQRFGWGYANTGGRGLLIP